VLAFVVSVPLIPAVKFFGQNDVLRFRRPVVGKWSFVGGFFGTHGERYFLLRKYLLFLKI
jgi:hypothetical protein